MYTNTRGERESDSKRLLSSSTNRGSVIKRLLLLVMITMSLVLAGAQTAPTAQASRVCNIVCGEPFIDPNDGQCKQLCCPQEEECKVRCELRPCKIGS